MDELPPPVTRVELLGWRGEPVAMARSLPEEVAVAITYDHASFAVMMASPTDLRDFAIGFSLSEGIIAGPSDVLSYELVVLQEGLECRMLLTPAKRNALEDRRRRIAGPVGCGLCGMESLAEAIRAPVPVQAGLRITPEDIMTILEMLPQRQLLNIQTRGVHAAGFFTPRDGALLVREDVGRHNALDKLIGAVAGQGRAGRDGVVVLTSRVSIELIQKIAAFGAGVLIAVSVPSARAMRDAEAAGITLIAVARQDGFEVFTHPHRVIMACAPAQSSG